MRPPGRVLDERGLRVGRRVEAGSLPASSATGHPSAYGVYRTLVTAERLPESARVALKCLRRAARDAGGELDEQGVRQIDNELARAIGLTALRHRQARRIAKKVAQEHESQDPLDVLTDAAIAIRAARKHPGGHLRVSELTQKWFAGFAALDLVRHAWGHRSTREDSSFTTSDLLLLAQAELRKWTTLRENAGRGPPPKVSVDAFADFAINGSTRLHADPQSIAHAARHATPVHRELWEAVVEKAEDPLLDEPHVALGHISTLKSLGLRELATSALTEDVAATALPATRAVLDLLEDDLLMYQLFSGISLGARTHLLPSASALIDLLMSSSALREVAAAGKGVSTSPLAVVSIEKGAVEVHTGFGDGRVYPHQHAARLSDILEQWAARAQRAGRKLLILGDGVDSARAYTELAAKVGPTVAYVEFTQSGLNYLLKHPVEGSIVESFADTDLKKLAEIDAVGRWIAEREVQAMRHEGQNPSEVRATVVGAGNIGLGVAYWLQRLGVQIQLADTDPAALKSAQEILGLDDDAVHLRTEDSLPPSEYYFACSGSVDPGAIGMSERAIRALPDGATIVNCASRGEIDEHFLLEVWNHKAEGVEPSIDDPERLPEHQTLRLAFGDSSVRIRNSGQPYFDGKKDKNPVIADIYMSGLLISLVRAARRLKGLDQEGPAIRSIPPDLQLKALDTIEDALDTKLPSVRRALAQKVTSVTPSAASRRPKQGHRANSRATTEG